MSKEDTKMNYKIEYEFKTDSIGRKYALRHDLTTDKRERIEYNLAHTRQTANIARHKREKIKSEIKAEDVDATYKEYKYEYKKTEKAIIKKREKSGKEAYTKGALKARVKKIVITQKLGIRTRFNYAWTWSIKLYYKNGEGIQIFDCETNNFMAGGRAFNGNHFEDFIEIVKDAFNRIPDKEHLCYLDGGSCVTLYNKSDNTILNKFQQGQGCGFSFDFKNYENDNNMINEPDIVDL
jgi:hypothetical protein